MTSRFVLYNDDLEQIHSSEKETQEKIVQVMIDGQHTVKQQSKLPQSVRISHAKAHALLQGELIIDDNLPEYLAQGLFAQSGSHPVLVRLAQAPGEITDDSKINTVRGMAIKVFNVNGEHLPPFESITTQDVVLDTGKEFFAKDSKSFLQNFKPNATIAPNLSDNVKGLVSDVARATNQLLNTMGMNSEKLDFFGHNKNHPMDEEYYSQTPYRYGKYIAKFGVVPSGKDLLAVKGQSYNPTTYNAMRGTTNDYFQSHPAEFSFVVQLNTDIHQMPIENAMSKWSEELSPYCRVGKILLPIQSAYDYEKDQQFEELSFNPAHCLVDHKPLGSVNRARILAYTALSKLRRQENHMDVEEPKSDPTIKTFSSGEVYLNATSLTHPATSIATAVVPVTSSAIPQTTTASIDPQWNDTVGTVQIA